MTPKNLLPSDKRIEMNSNIPAVVSAQLVALRDLALVLAHEVEGLQEEASVSFEDGISIYTVLRRYEISLIQRALRLTNGNQKRASELLGLKPSTLNAKIKRFDIVTIPNIAALAK